MCGGGPGGGSVWPLTGPAGLPGRMGYFLESGVGRGKIRGGGGVKRFGMGGWKGGEVRALIGITGVSDRLCLSMFMDGLICVTKNP